MRCPNCNTQNDSSRNFCSKCGSSFKHTASEEVEMERRFAKYAVSMSGFPIEWIESDYVLFYYLQAKVFEYAQLLILACSIIIPLFVQIRFGNDLKNNVLLTMAIGILVLILISIPTKSSIRKRAEAGDVKGVPIIRNIAKRIQSARGANILKKARRKRLSSAKPNIYEVWRAVKDEEQRRTLHAMAGTGLDGSIVFGLLIGLAAVIIAFFKGLFV